MASNQFVNTNLDVLRTYAVLSVYFGHLLQVLSIEKLAGSLTIYTFGKTGVLIFFVHTALVLMMSMSRMNTGTRLAFFASFYFRRAVRIYPLSIAVLTVMVIYRIPAFPDTLYDWHGWKSLLSSYLLVQNITRSPQFLSVLWSLPYEVQMYAVLPALFLILCKFKSVWVPCVLWLSSAAVLKGLSFLGVKGIPALLWYVPCFLGGVLAYRLHNERRLALPFYLWPVFLTGCVVVRALYDDASTWLVCLLIGAAIPQFKETSSSMLRTTCEQIAKYSYGLYLTHTVVFWFVFVELKSYPFAIKTLLCLGLSVAIPVLLFKTVEEPLILWGHRLTQQFGGKCELQKRDIDFRGVDVDAIVAVPD